MNNPPVAEPAATDLSKAAWHRGHSAAAALVLVFFGTLIYSNSFQGVFVFDDDTVIVENPALRTLWPPWSSMFCRDFAMRPLVGCSFALNFAAGGLNPWGYHAVNLGAHLLASLALFGLLRRTLEALQPRFGGAAGTVAFVIALLWLIHPLNTQAVTYIVQRSEATMGMFFLTALYCSVRGSQSSRPRAWSVCAVAAAVFGMGCKQVMAGAPLLVLLHDRCFLSGSFGAALRRRPGMYAGLAASWLVLAALIVAAPRSESAGFGIKEATPVHYALTQFGVIVHYLTLSIWPAVLRLDYQWPLAKSLGEVAPQALLVLFLLAATVYALRRAPAWGFLGAWFFVTLAPTSSIMPLADFAVEHRMYLALCAVIGAVVAAGYCMGEALFKRTGNPGIRLAALLVITPAIFFLSRATVARNRDYHSAIGIWKDTLQKTPNHFRAHTYLGVAYIKAGQPGTAMQHFEKALALRPDVAGAHVNVGNQLQERGEFEKALTHFQQAVALEPARPEIHYNLANTLSRLQRHDEALQYFSEAARLNPGYTAAHLACGMVRLDQQQPALARPHLELAVQQQPADPAGHFYLGRCLAQLGERDAALQAFKRVLELDPGMSEAKQAVEKLEGK